MFQWVLPEWQEETCFPKHDKCHKGIHSHENDETGRCIPDSTPCEPGFIRDPDFPRCSQRREYAINIQNLMNARTMTVNQYHVIDMEYLVLVVMITDVIIQDSHSIHAGFHVSQFISFLIIMD